MNMYFLNVLLTVHLNIIL